MATEMTSAIVKKYGINAGAEYLNSNTKLLPVVVSGNSASLTQSLLNTL